MGSRFAFLIGSLAVVLGFGGNAHGQACTGTSRTTVSGTVYAPNGTDPLPNVTVYLPTTTVDPFPPGVSCPLVGAPLPGNPIVGTETKFDGSFTLFDVQVGSNIPLVIVSGRWRRKLTIPSVAACQDNPMPANFAVMPSDQTQGDIPKIAIATGSADSAECVLLKMGINKSEFTDPSGSGRINLYGGGTTPLLAPTPGSGVILDAGTQTQAFLMGGDGSILNQYDVLMLPCEGSNYLKPAQELANLVSFADHGGRVYASHYSYSWMYQNFPFNTVASWLGGVAILPDGDATVNTTFTGGQTLAQWLALPVVNASPSPGQMAISTLRHDVNGVNPPTQSWLTLNSGTAGDPNPVMQFVWDTPILPAGKTGNQCGRVLFNEYHVENPLGTVAKEVFPAECGASTAMTPQEKLLEYMLFELTDEGGQPSLDPTIYDFGSLPVGFSSAPVTFTWKNNSSFTAQVTSAKGSGDFAVTADTCLIVVGGASCQITVVYTPSALGAETGTLTVVSSGNSLISSLTGTGTPGFSLSGTSLSFGNLDVGNTASQTLTLTSVASKPLPVPPFVTTGQYLVDTSACGATVQPLASCQVKVTFRPTSTGPQNGTLGVSSPGLLYSGLNAALSGNGVDFTLSINPSTGTVVAGDGTTTTATLTPLAGFAAPVSLVCTVGGAVASNCGLSTATVTPTAATAVTLSMSTTSQFTVIGYGGIGGRGYLWLVGMGSGLLLWRRRRSADAMLRAGLMVAFLAAIGLSLSGCSGKLPVQNAAYTGPGSYTVNLTATDGFLVHTATYTLTVNAK